MAAAKWSSQESDAAAGDALAAPYGIQLAGTSGFSKPILKMNRLEVIQAITALQDVSKEVGLLALDIKFLAESFDGFGARHIPYLCNKVAHQIV